MIGELLGISKIKDIQNNSVWVEFNSTLPVNIKVLEAQNFGRYKMLVGNKTLFVKSQKELKKHTNYWGELKKDKNGVINISNLLERPNFFEEDEEYFFDYREIDTIEYKDKFYDKILMKLINSKDKKEFLYFTNILVALCDDIVLFPFIRDNKFYLLQYKIIKNNFIKFYFLSENLGPISGEIEKIEDNFFINLYIYYNKTLLFLKEFLQMEQKIQKYMKIYFHISKNIEPIFTFSNNLLDKKI